MPRRSVLGLHFEVADMGQGDIHLNAVQTKHLTVRKGCSKYLMDIFRLTYLLVLNY